MTSTNSQAEESTELATGFSDARRAVDEPDSQVHRAAHNGALLTTRPQGGSPSGRRASPWRPLSPGEAVSGTAYRVVRQRDVGGMGELYEVQDRAGGCAALKVLSARLQGRSDLVGRMVDEACALRHIRHDNLVRWIDGGVLGDGRPFVLTELLRGRTLRSHVDRCGAVSPPRARRWTAALLLALDAVHRYDLVHCDVKLDNVFLCVDGSIKLLDLGAAEPANDHRAPACLPPLGTPRYMAPEQVAGHGVDERTDVYAAGLLLAELLCGSWPFAVTPAATDPLAVQLAAHLPRLRQNAPDLLAVVGRAAAPAPEARYPNALAMARKVLSPTRRSGRRRPSGRAAVRLAASDQ